MSMHGSWPCSLMVHAIARLAFGIAQCLLALGPASACHGSLTGQFRYITELAASGVGRCRQCSGLDQAGAPLLAQPVTVAADGDDMAVVEQAVEDGSRHDRIAEDGAPFANRAVGGDQHAAAFVTARHQLEEEMRRVWFERQIAEFVDDQELGFGEEAEALFETTVGVRLDQPCHQRRRRHEEHRIALADGGAAEPDGKMGLADAGRAEHEQRVAMGNPAARRQSRIWPLSSEGCAVKSKPSRSRSVGKWAILVAISTRRWL